MTSQEKQLERRKPMSDKYETTRKQKDAVYVKIVNIREFLENSEDYYAIQTGDKENNCAIQSSDFIFRYFPVGILVGLRSINTEVCD
jgi:hypothetical protein